MQRNNVVIIFILFLMSCATTPRITNLSPADLYGKPLISSYQDPDANFYGYKTFSVFPYSLISKKITMNEIMEKQVLFFLRNQLEGKGYQFVNLYEKPDFLITIDASSEYHESYVPPQTVSLPQWVPGQTITTYGNTSGTFNYNTLGNYSSYGWGTYSGQTTSTSYIPGYMTTQRYTMPGYTVGRHYPSVKISVYDGKTLNNVWLGTGVGTSDISDVRISSQFVVDHVLSKFPAAKNIPVKASQGIIGIGLGVFTNDGNIYAPTVLLVVDSSPAEKVGIKEYDMILAIDGISVINKSLSDIHNMLNGEPGSSTSLEVWRVDKKLQFNITRASRNKYEY